MRFTAPLAFVAAALVCGLACSGKYDGDAAIDASAEASRPEPTITATSAPPDAAPDGPIVDAAPPSPCVGQHFFCDDFERTALGESWDGVSDDTKQLALEVSPSCARGSRCLRARLDGDPVHESSLRRSFPMPPAGIVVTMSIALADLVQTGGGGVGFMFVSLPLPGTRFRHFNFFVSNEGVAIQSAHAYEDGGSSGQSRTLGAFRTGARKVKVSIVPRAGAVDATASMDDGTPSTVTLEGGSDSASLVVGASYRPGTTGGTVHVDDVVVDRL